MLICHNLSFAQVKAECKLLELCIIQHSAKVRSSAVLAISSFLPPCQLIFLERGTICFVTSKKLLESKSKVLV